MQAMEIHYVIRDKRQRGSQSCGPKLYISVKFMADNVSGWPYT